MTKDNKDIEITLAHLEQQITDLSDMVSRQWREIDRLRKSQTKDSERLDHLENNGPGAGSEKPPHY